MCQCSLLHDCPTGTCTSSGLYASCNIQLQRAGGLIVRNCNDGNQFGNIVCQNGRFRFNGNLSSTPYVYCCSTSECNTEAILQQKISEFLNPSTVTHTSFPISTEVSSSTRIVPTTSTKVIHTTSEIIECIHIHIHSCHIILCLFCSASGANFINTNPDTNYYSITNCYG